MNIREYAKRKNKSINTIRKQIACQIYTGVVMKTPVDTGRARGNWQLTIGHDSTSEIDRLDPNEGQPPNDLAEKQMEVEEMGSSEEPIFISNNLPYIEALEYGHSKKAPLGMVGLTMQEVKSGIKKIIKDSKF